MELNEENNDMADEDFQARQEEIQKLNKSNQVYKETITLIKMKMSKADTLIRQYSDKVKECDLLNEDLAVLKNDKEDALKKYNQTMEKLTKLELSNSSYKESLETLNNLSENQKIKLDENEKHINQLTFKIKDAELQISTLEEQKKTLEQEIKSAKVSVKNGTKKMKHQAIQTLVSKTQETAVNTDPIVTSSPKKVKMKNKSVMTDKITNSIKEPFPIFCSNCDILVEPPPVDQILKIMSSNPPLISPISLLSEYVSPPCSPNLNVSRAQPFDPIEMASCSVTKNEGNNFEPSTFSNTECKNLVNISKETEHSSFMEIDSLNRKINKLEKLMKNVKKDKQKKERNCCHQNCCSSKKNIKFVVQLPNQEEIFEYRKREKRKQQYLKLSKKRLNILKRQNRNDKWKIESCTDLKKKRKMSSVDLRSDKRSKKKKLLNQDQSTLFESEKDLFSDDELSENYNSSSKSLSPSYLSETHSENLPSNKIMETNLDVVENPIQNVNINQLNVNSKIVTNLPGSSQTSVSNANSPNDLEKVNNNLPGSNAAINKSSEETEVLFSNRNIDLSIESKTNEQLDTVNDEEKLEISLTSQLPHEIPNITNIASVEQSTAFVAQPACIRNLNRLSTNSSPHTSSTEIKKQFSDGKNKLLLSTKCTNDNLICSPNIEESQKSSTDVINDNNLSVQLPCGSATNNNEQTYENSIDKGNFQTACKESIKLEIVTKNKQRSFDTETSTNSQKVSTSEIPKGNDLLIQSTNKELITDDCLSDSQMEIAEQDMSCNEIESNNDAIASEESSEDNESLPSMSRCRILNKKAKKSSKITQKKKLLKIIRNIRKGNKRPITCNKIESTVPQVVNKSNNRLDESLDNSIRPLKQQPNAIIDNISDVLPIKKQRIAHTPKSVISVNNDLNINSINENCELNVPVENTPKKTSIIPIKHIKESKDKISLLLEDYNKTCRERIEIEKNLRSQDPSNLDFSLLSTNTNKQNTTFITENEDYMLQTKEYNLRDMSLDLKSNEPQKEESLISDKSDIDNTVETNFIAKDNESEVNNKKINEQEKEVTVIEKKEKTPTIELRSRQVIVNKDSPTSKAKKLTNCQTAVNAENILVDSVIIAALNNYIKDSNSNNCMKYKRKKIDSSNNKKKEIIIGQQLELLMQSEWTTTVNSEIVENLLNSVDITSLTFFLIEFICERFDEDEEFDKSHTPPAPIMTRSEQKIVTLILSINKIHTDFSDIVIKGISCRLFKLGKPQPVHVLERLFRILVVLSKIKKDREKLRIFLCDALYSLKLRAINLIYVALTCWSEVFPKYNSNNDILVKTIVHIVMTQETVKAYPKLISLRNLLSTYYEYPNSGYTVNSFKAELVQKLLENVPGVNTAILLFCKKMGPVWTMENMINSALKPIIVTQVHPSVYEVLTLLGNLLRSFPKIELNSKICEIIDQLCEVLDKNTGSDDMQEGIVSCLLSISQYKFEQIARFVIKWKFNKELRDTTIEQLNSFFKIQDPKWWWRLVKANTISQTRVEMT